MIDADETQIDCEEALDRMAAFLDRELDAREAGEVEAHLERCRSCYSRAEFERKLKERIRKDLGIDEVPPDFEERVRGLLGRLSEEA